LREHPAELAQSHGSSSEIGDNSDFPSPVNQRDSELKRLGSIRIPLPEDATVDSFRGIWHYY
jgi:hypothetical protein